MVVKPDDEQKKDWKSNAYALFEFHYPRDIDNFRPFWKSLFSNGDDSPRKFGGGLKENFVDRMGVYGGLKVGEDPLSNLYSGVNYGITRELGVNFGWVWANTYDTQITNIGNITSLPDALKYAKRSYGKPTFSIGISFAPAVFASMLGIKTKSE